MARTYARLNMAGYIVLEKWLSHRVGKFAEQRTPHADVAKLASADLGMTITSHHIRYVIAKSDHLPRWIASYTRKKAATRAKAVPLSAKVADLTTLCSRLSAALASVSLHLNDLSRKLGEPEHNHIAEAAEIAGGKDGA
jgi:hypothetical protein